MVRPVHSSPHPPPPLFLLSALLFFFFAFGDLRRCWCSAAQHRDFCWRLASGGRPDRAMLLYFVFVWFYTDSCNGVNIIRAASRSRPGQARGSGGAEGKWDTTIMYVLLEVRCWEKQDQVITRPGLAIGSSVRCSRTINISIRCARAPEFELDKA